MNISLENWLRNKLEENEKMQDYAVATDTVRCWIDVHKAFSQDAVISIPIEVEPVLAEIEHISDLGKSTWYEVVYFDGNWRCYAGSKTFKDGERVIKWKYAKDCL